MPCDFVDIIYAVWDLIFILKLSGSRNRNRNFALVGLLIL